MKQVTAFIFILLLAIPEISFAAPSARDIRIMIQQGDTNAVAKLIKANTDFVELQKTGGSSELSALELAAYFDQTDIQKMLIAYQPELIHRYGANALNIACSANRQLFKTIELLVASGVDINAKSKSGETCLFGAAVAVDLEFFKYLLGLGANPTVEVTPHQWLKIKGPISVEEFIVLRFKKHKEMIEHMKPKTGS